MNEKSDQKSDKVSDENVFVPNISSDNNANQNGSNNIKQTGTIPKTKNAIQNVINGVPEHKLKVNNNLLNTPSKNSEPNLLNNVFKSNDKPSVESQTNGFTYSLVDKVNKTLEMGHSYMNGTNQNEQDDLNSTSPQAGPSSSCSEKNQLPSVLSDSLHIDSDEYSSDTGNDELSCCDDCCIYTYKGDVADLPRSFMNLDQQDNVEDGSRAGSRGSSPEMDFLEMDFDPGPSCDAESDESSANIDLKDCDDKENSDNFNRDEIKNSEYQKKDFVHKTNVDVRPSTSKLVSNKYNLESNNYNFEPKPGCSKSNTFDPNPNFSKSDEFLKYDNNRVTLQSALKTESNKYSLESNNYNFDPQLNTFTPKPIFSKSDEFLKHINSQESQPSCSKSEGNIFTNERLDDPQNNLSQFKQITNNSKEQNVNMQKISLPENQNENNVNEPWIPKNPSQRTTACPIIQDSKGHHSSGGDLILWNENTLPINSTESRLNTSSSLYHSTMEKKLVLDKQTSNVESFIEKTMIWTEQEAALKQITQISTSGCGATAVVNVLKALGYDIPPNDKIVENVSTRLRANNSPLLRYLLSRSLAGSTHSDIISGFEKLSDGKIYARFFHMFPERYMNLSVWLSYWIKKGAVPIATLNLQKGVSPGGVIPDAWHHQMVFGVGPHGIYMTNPLERVEESLLWHHLTSNSELLVRREDVISRFDFKSLKEIMALRDVRWKRFNVVGQIANVVREHRLKAKILSRTHVSIPASYKAGITLAMDMSNPACELLRTCPELPIVGSLP